MSKQVNGFVFYRGPSMLNGKPIVAIATGIAKQSTNTKTGGGIIQTFILSEDGSPIENVKNGTDDTICGDCPSRGVLNPETGKMEGRICYVRHDQSPLVVWKAYKRGIYPVLSPLEASDMVAGLMVRLGTYGDPAALPFNVWDTMLARVKAKAGYTHQWARFPEFAKYCMASCETEQGYSAAKALGYRVFRVRLASEPLLKTEVMCPASKEAGNKTFCDACKACGGTSAKARADIAINVHGVAGKVRAYERIRERMSA